MACVSINALWAQLITCQQPKGTYVLYNVQHTSHGGRKQGVWEVTKGSGWPKKSQDNIKYRFDCSEDTVKVIFIKSSFIFLNRGGGSSPGIHFEYTIQGHLSTVLLQYLILLY